MFIHPLMLPGGHTYTHTHIQVRVVIKDGGRGRGRKSMHLTFFFRAGRNMSKRSDEKSRSSSLTHFLSRYVFLAAAAAAAAAGIPISGLSRPRKLHETSSHKLILLDFSPG